MPGPFEFLKKEAITAIQADLTAAVADDTAAAQAAKTQAETALADLKNIFYGPYVTAPNLRPDGSARVAGDTYFNTSSNRLNVWSGSAWVAQSGDMAAVNSLSEIGTGGESAKLEARLNLGVMPRQSLKGFRMKLAEIGTGLNQKANITLIGDSVSQDIILAIAQSFQRAYGVGEVIGGGAQVNVAQTNTGTTTVTADFTRTITGRYISLPTAATMYYSLASYRIGFTPAFWEVWYVSEPGAGTFKVQTTTDGTIFTDAVGFTSVSANAGSIGWQVLRVPAAAGQTGFRVTGVSGTVKIVSQGMASNRGAGIAYGLSDLGGAVMANMASAPAAIWQTYLTEYTPDLIIVMFKDDVDQAMKDSFGTITSYISQYAPNCTVVWVGIYPSQQDENPALPANQRAITQNAAIRDFLKTTTIPGERVYWPSDLYVGMWTEGATDGLFDTNFPPSGISGFSVSGNTVTVTTVAPGHNITNNNLIRVSGVTPSPFNGLFPATIISSTQFSFTLSGASGLSAPSGGWATGVDSVHLSQIGRVMLAENFVRDFALLTGLDSAYPNLIGTSAQLVQQGIFPVSGGNVTGPTRFTDATDVGFPNEGGDSCAVRTAGGIHAAKRIMTDTELGVGTTPSSTAAISSARSSAGAAAQDGIYSFSGASPTSGTNVGSRFTGVQGVVQTNLLGTSNSTGSNVSGVFGQAQPRGAGTGTITDVAGVFGEVDAQGAQTITSAHGVKGRISVAGAQNVTNGYAFRSLFNMSGSGTIGRFIGFFVDNSLNSAVAGLKWAFYNASNALSFMGTAGFRMASETGPIWNSGSGTPEGTVTAPVGSLWTRTDGGANTTLYVKESGTGNTGWVAK